MAFDSFEDLPADIVTPVGSLNRAGYTVTSSVFDDDFGLYAYDVSSGFGAFATDGDAYLVHQTDANESLNFVFDSAVNAFGFTITDWDDPLTAGAAQLMLGNNAGDKVLVTATPMMSGESLFFGIVNTSFAFTEVTLFNTSNNEAYGIDGVYFSQPVPLPAGILLLGSALTALGATRRSRKEPG